MASRRKKQVNIDVGHNIRSLRERAGLSREEFSELVGISSRFCATVEVGLAGISLETLKKICTVLNVSADTILWENREGNDYSMYIGPALADIDPALYPYIAACVREQVALANAAKAL